MTAPTTFCSTDLRVLQHQLADWRRSQSGRPRLPAGVWGAAAVLAHRHGPSPVARTLGLSYPKLRQWMRQAPAKLPAAPEPNGFVELKWGPPTVRSPEPVGLVELRDGCGRVLRLHTGRDPESWMALTEGFWRQGR